MLRYLIIFTIVFVISIAFLQSGFLVAQLSSLPAIFQKSTAEAQEPVTTYKLPLSPLKANAIAKAVITPHYSNANLVIDKLHINVPIIFNTPDNQTTILNNLEKGVVHYATSPLPGEKGTAVVLGHSSSYPWYKGNYGHVFALLNKLTVGDTFSISYDDGHVLSYKVQQSLTFSPTDTNNAQLNTIQQSDQSGIILLTCWPIGTNYHRMAVYAVLQ